MLDFILRNAALPGESELTDLAIDHGNILCLGKALTLESRRELDLHGRLLVPGFVEPHLHLDIAMSNSWQRPGRQDPYTSLKHFNEVVEARRAAYTSEDIQLRAGAALELASRHGITAVRAQCHVDLEVGLKHLEALLAVKEKYARWVSLQIVAFPQQGLSRPGSIELFREAFRLGADVMGCAPNLDPEYSVPDGFRTHIDRALALAMELDVDLDAHADLGLRPSVSLEELEVVYLAQRALETGYVGRIAAGHVCTLDSATQEVAEKAIQLMQKARINVISQPDLYRLGRDDTQHVRRGLTRVKALLHAGVNVSFASNNVRDGYRPLGNLNPLEEALILAYGAHMDTIDELDCLLTMCTTNPAQALRLPSYGLEPGCRADLVVLDAPTPSAAVVGQAEQNYVFKEGRLVAANRVISETFNDASLQKVCES